MGSKVLLVISAAFLLASNISAHAENGLQVPGIAGLSPAAVKAIRMPTVFLRSYDIGAIQAGNGFAYRPTSSTLLLIDSGAFKLEVRNDGRGHYALATPLLRGAGVGGELRRGGGIFRISWPTSN